MFSTSTMLAMVSAAIGSIAVCLAILARCSLGKPRQRRSAVHLQEGLLQGSGAAETTSEQQVVLAPTKIFPSAIAAFAYLLALCELLQLWLDELGWPRALRALAFLTIGMATEAEAGLAPHASAPLPSRLLWRARALLRLAATCALAGARVDVQKWHVQPISGYNSDWQWVDWAMGGSTALLACAILLALVIGPPRLVPAPSPPPPMHRAWLLPKLLYAFWTPVMLRLFRKIQACPDEPLRIESLPRIDPSISAASAWAVGTSSRSRRQAKQRASKTLLEAPAGTLTTALPATSGAPASLVPEMWQVVRLDATLQFLWCFAVLFVEYAAPLGMLGLIGYIQSRPTGAVPPSAIFFGAMVALGPLMLNVCHGQANASGWRFGTKLRAYITRAVCEKALRFDSAASDQSIGQMTNLLAVDAQNIVQFAGVRAARSQTQ